MYTFMLDCYKETFTFTDERNCESVRIFPETSTTPVSRNTIIRIFSKSFLNTWKQNYTILEEILTINMA